MKQFYLTFLGCLLLQNLCYSQRIYVKAGAGYNWPSSSETMGVNAENKKVGIELQVTKKVITGTYGAGVSGGITFGCKINDYFGLEAGFSYLKGKTYDATVININENRATDIRKTYAKMPAFQAAFLMQANQFKLKPYTKLGLVAAAPKIYYHHSDIEKTFYIIDYSSEAKGKVAFGLLAGFGLNYAISNKFGLFAEGNFTSLSYSPHEQEITKYEINGEDKYGTIPLQLRRYVYETEVTDYYHENGSEKSNTNGSYKKENSFRLAFSAVGVQGGVRFTLF